jgi:IMP cyclohydrolase
MDPSESLEQRAAVAFADLARNPYPGRGLVIGRSAADDAWLQVYWIMGRSPHSRNRRFVVDGAELRTEPVDPALVEDPSLIIYEAMLEMPGRYLVSNGDQTRTLREGLEKGETFETALRTREREPDAPNYTPRISGMLDLRAGAGAGADVWLSLLRAGPADPERTERTTFELAPPPPGLARGLTTYQGDGSPLPGFCGEPSWLPLPGDPAAVLEAYWDALDPGNRVALAVKCVPDAGGPSGLRVRNRFDG